MCVYSRVWSLVGGTIECKIIYSCIGGFGRVQEAMTVYRMVSPRVGRYDSLYKDVNVYRREWPRVAGYGRT